MRAASPLFHPATPADYKPTVIDKLLSRLTWVNGQLAGKPYLMGDAFSVANPYMFTVTNWAPRVGVDITGWPISQPSANAWRRGLRYRRQCNMKVC